MTTCEEYQPASFGPYCFIVSILASIHSAYQLFKGVCDIAYIYSTFYLRQDIRLLQLHSRSGEGNSNFLQLVAYLLISSSSILILTIHRIMPTTPVWKYAVVSTSMPCITFVIIAISTLQSGYKLCKRLIW
ncbi:hypothetical protein MKW92_051054 [Papaver armeniacum]|nr:hypothetical protein MKW92_051054 [Papaver armeniacum]